MTNEEALLYFKDEMKDGKCNDGCKTCDAMLVAIDVLEKQIPKKPLPDNRYYGNGKCPTCNAVFLDKSTQYCGNCGQAIDWTE